LGATSNQTIEPASVRVILQHASSDFLPGLADFWAFLAEIENRRGVTPTIRLK